MCHKERSCMRGETVVVSRVDIGGVWSVGSGIALDIGSDLRLSGNVSDCGGRLFGGCVYRNGTALQMTDLTVTNSTQAHYGGVAYCIDSDVSVTNVTLIRIEAVFGGAFYFVRTSVSIAGMGIDGVVYDDGGVIYSVDSRGRIDDVSLDNGSGNSIVYGSECAHESMATDLCMCGMESL